MYDDVTLALAPVGARGYGEAVAEVERFDSADLNTRQFERAAGGVAALVVGSTVDDRALGSAAFELLLKRRAHAAVLPAGIDADRAR